MIQTTGGVSTATYSVNWTPLTPGTYSWIASYPGDGNNQASETNCSDANEQITVNAASPGMTTKAVRRRRRWVWRFQLSQTRRR